MKRFVNKHKYLCLSLLMVLAVFSYFAVFNNSIFLFAGDSFEQQYKFYYEAWHRLRDSSLPFWDWSNFLGNNYFGSNTFYFLGSPFFWLAMILPKPEMIQYSFLYLNLLKSILCVVFSYMWLQKTGKNSLASALCALIPTFSSFVLFNYTNNHIFDAICFIPLILYFAECYLDDRSGFGLSLSVGYLGIINYYFLYLAVPFVCIYTLVRYFVVTEKPNFSGTLKDGSLFVLRVMLGILISCVTLLPSFLALRGNPRSSELVISLRTVGKFVYYRFLTSFLSPICDWRLNLSSYISTSVDPGVGWGGGFADYSFVISLVCLPLLLFVKNKRERNGAIVLTGVYFIFALFPLFYVLFNQNYETRWVYVFTFILAYVASIVLNEINEEKSGNIITGCLCVSLIAIACFMISYKGGLTNVYWEIDALKRNTVIVLLFIATYCVLFELILKRRVNRSILFVVIFAEIIFSFYSTFFGLNNDTYKAMTLQEVEDYTSNYKGAAEYIKDTDPSFYRIDKNVLYDNLGGNDVYYQRYNSFYSYHSIYNYRQQEFINDRFSDSWQFGVQTGKDILKTMLGSKYWFTYEKDGDYLVPYGYDYLAASDDGGKIYINKYPLTFAYSREKTISKEDFDSFDTLHQDYLLLDHVVVDDCENSDKQLIADLKQLLIEGDGIVIDTSGTKGYFYIAHPKKCVQSEYWTRPNWHLFDKSENELYSSYVKREYGYVGLSVFDDEYSSLDLRHVSNSSVYYDDMSWFNDWYNIQEMVDPDTVEWNDNSISGDIKVGKDSYIVTSIPYDKGWKLKVDGQTSDYIMVNEGFIGFNVSEGLHHLEFVYTPPGLVLGLIVSVLSMALCVSVEYSKKKRKI